MEIIFNNSRTARVNERLLRKLSDKIGKNKETVSVSFIDEKLMRQLNRFYRRKDSPTDVLSFNMDEDGILGDILICTAVARRNAKDYHTTYMEEVCRLFVHGLLHLLGYDHGKVMFKVQDKILGQ
jgi:probable rRNA maturation factor